MAQAATALQIPLFQPNKLEQGFAEFHRDNPQVYVLFKHFTMQVIARGHKHYSADAVVHRIRWETSIVTTGECWKINNDHVAKYARMFMEDYPQHEGFFRTRER